MVTLFYQTAIDHVYFYEIEFAKLIIRYHGVSDVEIRRNEIIELLYTYKKYSIDDFAKRFGVSRRTINYDIVYLMDFYEIDTKPGPHGGISLINRRPNSHTAYLKPIEIEWLRRKYNEAETDRMAAHSILRRFSL